jgi:3'(2'), 5'-bisphosphate nucleotidase
MSVHELKALASALHAAMWAASEAVASLASSHLKVARKADYSPVSEADLIANEILLKAIRALSDAPILSEEGCGETTSGDPVRYWAVDPLDGTKEFLSGSSEYTVNVALVEQGVPVLGLVTRPATGELWQGVLGAEALHIQHGQTRILRVQAAQSPPRVALSRSHGCGRLDNCLNGWSDFSAVALGSSLKLVLIAEAKVDLYPRMNSGMSQWDLAAGHAVVLAAGGRVLGFDGEDLRYRMSEAKLPPFIAFGDAQLPWQSFLARARGMVAPW